MKQRSVPQRGGTMVFRQSDFLSISLGLIGATIFVNASVVQALPSPVADADATAKWETVVIPSAPVSDPSLAQQVAIIPIAPPDDHSLSSGTAVQGAGQAGAIVRGLSEVGFALPGSRGGGSLEATSRAHTVTVYQASGTGPIDLDIKIHIGGSLEGGNFFTDSPGNVTSEAAFDAILHTSAGAVPLFTGNALFDIAATPTASTLTVLGDWTLADFSPIVPVSLFNQGRSVNLNDLNENAAIVNPGEEFAIELFLDTSVFAVGAFEAAARANFDSTGGFTLSTDAPGASFRQVPEPASAMLMLAALLFMARKQKRHILG